MRGLKALVIIMGVLILAGLAVIVVTLIDRNLGSDRDEARNSGPTPSTASYDTKIPIPAGASIVETEASDTRLIIRLKLANGASRLLIIDPATGRRIGVIDLPESSP